MKSIPHRTSACLFCMGKTILIRSEYISLNVKDMGSVRGPLFCYVNRTTQIKGWSLNNNNIFGRCGHRVWVTFFGA